MKKIVVVISIFLFSCGGATTETGTSTSVVDIDKASAKSNIIVKKFNISSISGKYSYSYEKLMGVYKISGFYDLTLNKDFSYKLFKTILDEYNDNKPNYESFTGRYSYDGFNTIDFVNGDFGERGGKIYLSESNLQGNLDQITVTFSSRRGNAMYFYRIIERKPIFTAENVKQPTTSSSIDNKDLFVIDKFIVAENDLTDLLNWEDSKKACIELGEGWRLPSKKELNLLFQNKEKIGGFVETNYWSSTQFDGYGSCYQNFTSGYQSDTDKRSLYHIRCIKNL